MRLIPRIGVLAALALAGACMPLDVENTNDPDADRALSDASDVEALLGTGFYRYINGTMKNAAPARSVAANEVTSSWGNFGMQNAGTLPRGAYDNSPTASYRHINQIPWGNLYEGLSNVADGLHAIEGGMTFDDDGVDTTDRARAYGKFVQGVITGWLASFYDQVVIFDEETLANLEETSPEPIPYTEAIDRANAYLEESISIAESAAPFQLPGGEQAWIHGNTLNNEELAQWAHSFLARNMTSVARTPADRAAVDWDRVIFHLDRGVQESVGPVGEQSSVIWWHRPSERPSGWLRVAYDLIGPADTAGNYEEWLATDPLQRQPFVLETADRRIVGPEGGESNGKYMRIAEPFNLFPSDRGQYFQSAYWFTRFSRRVHPDGWALLQPVLIALQQEHLRAEALLRTGGDRNTVVDIVNIGRVENGELEPLPYDVSDEELWRVFAYEKALEQAVSMASQNFFDRRAFGTMICGSPTQYPIPGTELEVMLLPNYTFGGSGEGAATPEAGCRTAQEDALNIIRN